MSCILDIINIHYHVKLLQTYTFYSSNPNVNPWVYQITLLILKHILFFKKKNTNSKKKLN